MRSFFIRSDLFLSMYSIAFLLIVSPSSGLRLGPHLIEHSTTTTVQHFHGDDGEAPLTPPVSEDMMVKPAKIAPSDDPPAPLADNSGNDTPPADLVPVDPQETHPMVSTVTSSTTAAYSLSTELGTASESAQQSLVQSHLGALASANTNTCKDWLRQGDAYSDEVGKIKSFSESVSTSFTAVADKLHAQSEASSRQRLDEETADKAVTDATPLHAEVAELEARADSLKKTGSFDLPVLGFLQQFEGTSSLLAELSTVQEHLIAIGKVYEDLLQDVTSIYNGSEVETEFKCPESPKLASGAKIMSRAADLQIDVLTGIQLQASLKLLTAVEVKAATAFSTLHDLADSLTARANDEKLFAQIESILKQVPDLAQLLDAKFEVLKKEATASASDMEGVIESFSAVISLEFSNPPVKDLLNAIFATN